MTYRGQNIDGWLSDFVSQTWMILDLTYKLTQGKRHKMRTEIGFAVLFWYRCLETTDAYFRLHAKIILYFKQSAFMFQKKHFISKFYCSSLQTDLKKKNGTKNNANVLH